MRCLSKKLFFIKYPDVLGVDILYRAFLPNKRLTKILKRPSELKKLIIFLYLKVKKGGGILLSKDNNAIILYQRGVSVSSSATDFIRYIYLLLFSIRPAAILKTLIREHKVSKVRDYALKNNSDEDCLYVSFLAANKSRSSLESLYELKSKLFRIAELLKLPIYIETTEPRLVQHYERLGFAFYNHKVFQSVDIWFARYQPNYL